jgi:alpha-tubulin suppressor-like RCC1 family protein
LRCWGYDSAGQATPNDFLFQQLATNGDSFCGLTVEGDLVCWGDTGLKPSGKGPYQQVQMGDDFICAQGTDGAVECQKRAETFVEVFAADLQITQFDCAKETCCGVSEDGTVHCWPEAPAEQPPQAALKVTASPLCAILQDESISCYMDGTGWSADGVPAGAFKDISVFGRFNGYIEHRCGLHTDGQIVCWGENNLGQCDAPLAAFAQLDVYNYNACDMLCDQYSVACAVETNAIVHCWGGGYLGNENNVIDIKLVPTPRVAVTQVVVGHDSACALRKDGRVACWGDMARGLNQDDFE